MYYLYGIEDKVAILIDVGQLTDTQKEYATVRLDSLPEKIEWQEGSVIRLFIEPNTLEVSYVYRDAEEEEEVAKKIEKLFE